MAKRVVKKVVKKSKDIDLSETILTRWDELCMSNELSDVTFSIEGTLIPAHKTVLSAHSQYFAELFSRSNEDMIKLDVTLSAFKILMKYFYTGRVSLVGLDTKQVIEVLAGTVVCHCDTLKSAIDAYLKTVVKLDNCCAILNSAILHSSDSLSEVCFSIMDQNATKVLKQEAFKTMPLTGLRTLLQRDTFFAPEFDIFQAVKAWYIENNGADPQVFSVIRWPLLSQKQILDVVATNNFLDPALLQKLIKDADGTKRRNKRLLKTKAQPSKIQSSKKMKLNESKPGPSNILFSGTSTGSGIEYWKN